MSLSPEQIDSLLKRELEKPERARKKLNLPDVPLRSWQAPEQIGPLRIMEKSGTCVSRGCRSPTPYKIQGIHYCTVHALKLLNEMLIAKGVLS